MSFTGLANIETDELIPASELNHQAERILDIAWKHPVTITRNEQSFALLRRDDITWMVNAAAVSKNVLEIINFAYKLRLGEHISSSHPLAWLKAFDNEELGELIVEIISLFQNVQSEIGDWDILNAVIHEWYESALAIQNPEIARALFHGEIDEVPLTPPMV